VNAFRLFRIAFLSVLAAAFCGCGSPNQVNIQLRKDNQTLSDKIADLQRRNDALAAQISAEENRRGATTQELPETELDRLYTVHGLEFGKLTGGYSPDADGPDQMVKVDVYPIDGDGQVLKAAGSFRIELFDLAEPETRLGTWTFPVEEAKGHWFGRLLLYSYIFDCPWQTPPRHSKLMLQATFTDELTGRQFSAQRDIEVRLPAVSG
jgi:outer membrane murein-binding lipoprotein Lpp